MSINFYAITGAINAIAGATIGLFVYLKNRKADTNRRFALFCLSAAVWSFAYFFWQVAQTKEMALFWARGLMAGAIFIPITYFHFVVAFLQQQQKRKKLLIAGYALCLFFFLINFTPLFVKDVTPKLTFSYWPEPGIFYPSFLLIFFTYVVYGWQLLFRALGQATGIRRQQIIYVLLGSIISFLGGSTNYFLWYNIPILPIGNAVAVVLVILIAYAILKHHLFNIRVIVTELLVGLVSLTLLTDVLLSRSLPIVLLKSGILLAFVYLGISLVRSVLREIEIREQVQKLAQQLQKINKKLKLVDKMKSEFISIASHQLRTPLSIIKGFSSMALEGDFGRWRNKKQKEVMEKIFISTERLIRMIEDLLNISRLEQGKLGYNFVKTDLERVLAGAVAELLPKANAKKLKLHFQKPEKHLAQIKIDVDKMRQVFVNLIDNAIKYTQEGEVRIGIKKEGTNLLVWVQDTGIGLTQEELASLFRRFTRGKRVTQIYTEGVGLGLYFAQKIVEAHHGKLWAESPGPGKGSTFWVRLPIKSKKK